MGSRQVRPGGHPLSAVVDYEQVSGQTSQAVSRVGALLAQASEEVPAPDLGDYRRDVLAAAVGRSCHAARRTRLRELIWPYLTPAERLNLGGRP